MTESVRKASEGALLEAPPEPHCSRGEVYVLPTSFAQRRLWFLDRFEPGSAVYNIPLAWRLEGPLDRAALAGALRDLARRHETLRTTFAEEREAPVQVVETAVRAALSVVDLSALPYGAARREGERLVAAQARSPFDLGRGPLLRAAAIRLGADRHLFLLSLHHAVADGWSLGVLRRELGALYRARRERPRAPAALPDLPIQYADYAAWQDAWLAGDETARQLDYWRARLAGAPEAMELPFSGPRPGVRGHWGGRLSRPLARSLTGALDALAREEGATRFMVYLAAWKLLLHRLGHHVGRPDAVVGTPVAGRNLEETEGLIGLFVNTLVLRTDCSGDPSFRELLARVKEGVLEAFAHSDLPFEKLVEELVPDRDLSYEPLVQVSFGLEEGGGPALDLPGVLAEPLDADHAGVKLDLSLLVEEREGGLGATLSYARDLYDPADANRLLRCYEALLEGVGRAPDRPVGELPVAPAAERHRLLFEWSAGEPVPGAPAPVHHLVEEQAARTPEAVAVVAGDAAVSYAELIRRSRTLAAQLRAFGVGEEARVGLALRRSPGLVSAMLAVLRCGGAYVPLDPAYPEERLAFIVEDAGIRVLLAERATAGRLAAAAERSGARVLLVDEPPDGLEESGAARPAAPEPEVPLDALAYVIYTSGSTGRPKGVAIAHRSAAAMIAWAGETFGREELSGLYAGTSVNFDLSVFELFVPLVRGGRVILGEDSLALAELPGAAAVRLVNSVPSAIAELARLEGLPASTATVNLAGEPLQRDLVESLYALPGVERVYNLYGPSEDTTYSTVERVPRGESSEPAIGRPVAGTRVLVLDRRLQPVPAGIPGELFLAGVGLARGYLGQPARTAERFLPDPFAAAGGEPGGRMYRTGDLVRFLPDGRLAFLGRLDHQVKLRGFRIELGEIEAALAGHPGVSEAAVLLRRSAGDEAPGEGRLIAYLAGAAGAAAPRAEELAGHLRRSLPAYMVPSSWVVLEALPLTPNGKIDRRALEAIDPETLGSAGAAGASSAADGGAPRSPEEEVLAELWAELLGVNAVSIHQSFFELGGHSLLATRLVSRVRRLFGVEVPLRGIFERPTVAGLAALIARGRGHAVREAPPLEPVPRDPPPPASFAQERLWFLDQLEGPRAAYVVPGAVRLRGALDLGALAAALVAVVDRHEVLRTRFESRRGEVVQVVAPRGAEPLPAVVDLRGLDPEVRRREARLRVRRAAARPFDLASGLLLRALLVRLGGEAGDDESVLLLAVHHVAFDGWSLGVLWRELAVVYEAGRAGRRPALPRLPVQYADYAAWQREWLSGEVLDQQLRYWRERLAGMPEAVALPADRPRPAERSGLGGRQRLRLAPPLAGDLRGLARERSATLFMVLLSGFTALLSRLTGGEDLAVGTPVAGRGRPELEGLVGFFVNTLVMRADLSGDPTFGELVGRVRETALAAWDRQDLPFERLVEELAPERTLSHSPLVQVVFTLQNAAPGLAALAGLETSSLEVGTETAKFDLTLSMREEPGRGGEAGLVGELEYSRDLFDRTTVRRLARTYEALLRAAAAAPDRPLSAVALLGPAERQQLLVEWNDTAVAYPRDRSIPELFGEQAALRPEAVALCQGGLWWSYRELDRRSERLAARLVAQGVGPETLVGLAAERSPELVAGLLAILKAGGAYLPLDASYPAERLAFMVEDGRVPVLVASASSLGRLPAAVLERWGTGVLALEEGLGAPPVSEEDRPPEGGEETAPAGRSGPRSLAYVLYTSGSSGRPKGVAVEHRSVVRLVKEADYASLSDDEVLLQLAPVPFDASTLEIWGALLNGGRLEIAAPGAPSLSELGRKVEATRVTTLWLTAGLFHQMVEQELPRLAGVRQLLAGGDVLSLPHVERVRSGLAAGQVLVNGYGPTEGTTFTCCHRMGRGERMERGPVPIGRPIASTRVYLLDRRLEPVPAGAPGELYLGGDGVARGYLARPALTAAAFVPDPFGGRPDGGPGARQVPSGGAPGARLYRTGDLARWLPGGEVEFLGRIDGQVKLRGFRIELGEIESVLAAHPAVAQAAVVVREDRSGDRRLVAYTVASQAGEPAPGALRAHLAERLPDYMVPAAYVTLMELPLSPNGKVDRVALPAPEPAAVEAAGERVPPRSPLEELIAGVWSEVLGAGEVGADEDFFELGGHSLLATRVVSRLTEVAGVEVPLRRLFEGPTVAALAAAVEELRRGPARRRQPPLGRRRPGALAPASFAQERLWFLDQLDGPGSAYVVAGGLRLTGELSAPALAGALARLVDRHESLRTRFEVRGGGVVQVVAPRGPRPLPAVVDLTGLPPGARWREAEALAGRSAARPFDLARGPLLRALVVREGERRHLLLLEVHHVVFDGWSLGVLFRELAELYGALRSGRPPALPELPLQYGDYAAWQREWLSGEALEEQLAYWRDRLAGAPEVLELPADRPRPAVQSYRGGHWPMRLAPELAGALRALARERGATLFMVLLAAFATLLSRMTGGRDVPVGTPVAGRVRPELERLIGLFVNTLVLRADLSDDPTFGELVERLRETALEGWARQDVPFEKLVGELAPERDLSHSPLFQVMLVLQNAAGRSPGLPGLEVEPFEVAPATAKFDLTLALSESGSEPGAGLRGELEYNRDLFDPTTVARLGEALRTLLESAVFRPEARVSELPLLGPAARHQLLREWNDTALPDPEPGLLHGWFEAQAGRTPDAVALVAGRSRWSYAELDRRAGRLAAHLLELGLGAEDPVGVCLERSPDMVVALLAVLGAGGAYVALDPGYPPERLATILGDAGSARGSAGPPPLVLTRERFLDRLPEAARERAVALERLAWRELPGERPSAGVAARPVDGPRPESLAYLLYTSGSTGRPKGVAVEHRSAAALLAWAAEAFSSEDLDGTLAATSINFDLSVFELFVPLSRGATVILADDALALAEIEEAPRVTLVNTVPSAMTELVRMAAVPESVRVVNLAGEALKRSLVDGVYGAARVERVLNLYGPSEDTTYSTWAAVAPGEPAEPTIGRPVAATRAHVLDPALREVPVGVVGELCLAGRGLARGYLARPAQTAERFVPDPFSPDPGGRLYRTGDLARRLPDGELRFLGRMDHQVKLRGFRIELGEIESALLARPEIREAVALAREDTPGDRRLVAYAVAEAGAAPEGEALRRSLAETLPAFMVPAVVMVLDELPLTPNRKVDRKALPAPEQSPRTTAFMPPRGPLEELVAEVWSDLLTAPAVGAHDNFFGLGGHSLLATRVVSRLRQVTGVDIPLRRMFESPTVAELARSLESALEAGQVVPTLPFVEVGGDPRLERRERDPAPASFAQERLWFLGQFGAERAQYNVPAPVRVEGPLDPAALARALAEIVRRHQALRTVFARGEAGVEQRVLPAPAPALPAIDLSGLAELARRSEARRLAAAEAREAFDLDRGPLFRARLVRVGREADAEEHLLLVSMHHIVSDGWSLAIFFGELAALYGAFRKRRPSPLAELTLQYPDFAVRQRRWLSGEVLARQVGYWRERLAGAPAVLELPTDRPRPPVQTLRGGEVGVTMPPGLLAGLRARSREHGVTLFMTLLAGLQTLLGRLGGGDDVVIGSPIAGRTRTEVEDLIGFFLNTLVHRGDLSGDPTFVELLARTRESALDAYSHQDLPFEKLVEELRPERNLAHSPVFQVMLVLQNAPPPAPALAGARAVEWFDAGTTGAAKFDLTLGLLESPEGLVGELGFNRDLFHPTTARRLLGQLETLLASAVEDPSRRLADLSLLTSAERHQLLHEWNDTALAPPEEPVEATLHGPFERRAAERPDAVAVVAGGGEHLSYRELDERAERLARALVDHGVGPGILVGVHLARRPEMAVAVLAVEKAGGAYVPLETGWPIERIRWIVAERGVRHLVTEGSCLASVAELAGSGLEHVLRADEDSGPAGTAAARSVHERARERGERARERARARWRRPALPRVGPEDPAYVIFTSGSTGHPKGVVVRHRPAANLVSWVNRTFAVGPDDRILFVTALSFDLSVYDLFGILAAGGTVRLAGAEELEDPVRQVELLVAERVTFWDSAPAALQRLAPLFPAPVDARRERPDLSALRLVFLSGDWVPLALPDRVRRSFPGAEVVALGGATEATVWSNYFKVGGIDPRWASIPYGRPIANARYHVLDRALRPCPIGVAGDLYIAGGCLSSGYAGSPCQTAESYLPDPFSGDPGAVLYRTGDRARYFADGNLEFLGRLDTQVKVRGFRIELGEIEAVLMEHPGISEAVVLAREDVPGDQRLVAYLISSGGMPPAAELRSWVLRKLPEYMVPSAWIERQGWPLSPTGKLDRKALPPPGGEPPAAATTGAEAVPARTALERSIAAVWREVLGVPTVGRDENFFDLGGHSLLLARVHERLAAELSRDLPMVELFRNPTVASLARALGESSRDPDEEPAPEIEKRRKRRRSGDGAVAVVGMAGRFPGARDVAELWRALRAGVESIQSFTDEELLAAGFTLDELADPSLVKARGALDDPDLFDAAFFGYSPREASVIDPQQRLFLESSWQALEDAGYGRVGRSDRRGGDLDGLPEPGRADRVGVFGGVSESSYLRRLRGDPELARTVGGHQIAISNNPDYLATRVSYKLSLTGPSVAVQTACSTSLVAVHMACRSLLEGECDLALAGGASVQARETSPYRYLEGGIGSPDGHVRTFDARAGGVVGGSGVGVVALKRLDDAVTDGDTIRAVIRGSAVNNDGGLKAGFTSPSAEGQAAVIRAALEAAGVDPATVGYVEAHGTATPLGDPIEVAGLKQAFADGSGREPGRKTCALGSIKTNLGHLDAAAGVAGLIKAILALEHREIPPSLHFERANPEIGLEESPFFVADRLLPWEADGAPRRAGVSSFGIGGTNAHLVLEEAPAPGDAPAADPGAQRGAELLVLSAKTEPALDQATERLAVHLAGRPGLRLADVAWTLQAGRRAFPHRRAVVCQAGMSAAAALREALEAPDRRLAASAVAPEEPPRVAFLFPGQGAQFLRMGEALYREEPVFRDALDHCAEVLRPELGLDLRELLYPEIDRERGASPEEAEERLARTELTQPALFALEHALLRLWESWGVTPRAMIGHSIGEYAAAARAGVFALDDALRLVAARGRLMGSRPDGAMLAVRLPEEGLAPLLEGEGSLALAAVNARDACVVAGPAPAVAELRERLEGAGVGCRALVTSHAFHSPMMDPVVGPFRDLVARLELRPPAAPFVSNVTGTWITPEEATDPGYWARQLRSPVRFAAGLSALLGSEEEAAGWALLEVGPGRTLTTLARRHPAAVGARALVSSGRHPRQAGSDRDRALAALGALWTAGVEVDWSGHHRGADGRVARRRVPLPTYPFERRSFWAAGPLPGLAREAVGATAPAEPAPAGRPARAEELSEAEAAVAGAFRDLLGVEAVGRADDFFELGGSSLMALELGGRLRERLGLPLPSDLLLQASSVGALAALVEERRAAGAAGEAPAASSPLVPLRRTGARRPLFLVHQVGGHVYSFRPLVQALPPEQPVYGLRSPGLEPGEEPLATVEAMAACYLALVREAQPRGPYRIGGASMGGMVAFEMARLLTGAGEEVEVLALMDTPCCDQMPAKPVEDWEFTCAVFLGRVPLAREELVGLDAEAQLRHALEKAERGGRGAGFSLDEARRLVAVLRANVEALFAYRPEPWDGRMVFFRALERRREDPPRPELPWIELARGGIEIELIPGNHATMHEPPHVTEIVVRLERVLGRPLSPGRPASTSTR